MEQFKRTQVVMLPTETESKIHLFTANKPGLYLYPQNKSVIPENPNCKNQHLYIISDDDIKEGDYTYHPILGLGKIKLIDNVECFVTIKKHDKDGSVITPWKNNLKDKLKKIIATTDNSLIIKVESPKGIWWDTSLSQPSQQFITKYIEEYNKGNVITDVLVEYDVITLNEDWSQRPVIVTNEYKLKINPKDNTITIKKLKDSWNREEVKQLLIDCCSEVSCEDGKLLGKEPNDLYKWIEANL